MEHIGELDKYLTEIRALLNAIDHTDVNYRIIRHLKELRKISQKAINYLNSLGYTVS